MPAAIGWLMDKPKKKDLQRIIALCENVAQDSADKLGVNTAEIRSLPHKTTRKHGKKLTIQNHVTMYWHNESIENGVVVKKDQKEGELFVDDGNTRMLKDSELDDNTKNINKGANNPESNPHVWDKS